MENRVLCLSGDGIGPEIMSAAKQLIDEINSSCEMDLELIDGAIGGAAYDMYGDPLPQETVDMFGQVDAILLGAVGDYKYDTLESDKRPERGLLKLRKSLDAFCNLRPIKSFAALSEMMPTKHKDIDFCFVRELVGGIYFGEKELGQDYGQDILKYSRGEVERIAKAADKVAMKRKGKITSIDKSNVLASSKLWRKTVEETVDSELNHMYVDNAAMQLIIKPNQFDVILTSNMFGDILSDEASALVGSIGVLPSASLGKINIYEPIHGSAPDIKGQSLANPIGMLQSVGMMYEHTYNRSDITKKIHACIDKVLTKGYGTVDLNLDKHVTTVEWLDHFINEIRKKD
jgi:3-isopropylmalate dehydrogenase